MCTQKIHTRPTVSKETLFKARHERRLERKRTAAAAGPSESIASGSQKPAPVYWDVDNISSDGFERTHVNARAKEKHRGDVSERVVKGIMNATHRGELSSAEARERLLQHSTVMSDYCDVYGELGAGRKRLGDLQL